MGKFPPYLSNDELPDFMHFRALDSFEEHRATLPQPSSAEEVLNGHVHSLPGSVIDVKLIH